MYTIDPTIMTRDEMSQMDTVTRYPRRVARQKWTPPNDEVNRRIEAAVTLLRQKEEIEAQYKAALAALADPDGDAVPIAHLSERLGVERKTIYRHLGRSMT